MPWMGGKSAISSTRTGRWIAGLLPYTSCYAEPFAGMLGVMLQRHPSHWEIANDLDSRVVNWWDVVREQHDELSRLISLTPQSRVVHARALREVDDLSRSPLQRAHSFTIIVLQSVAGRMAESAWGIHIDGNTGLMDWRRGMDVKLAGLARRLRSVQLENRDATEVLERLARHSDATVYLDPPYADTWGYEGGYRHVDDRDALAAVLRKQRGNVAISGYGDEWDVLGWERHELRTHTPNGTGSEKGLRTEGAVDELHAGGAAGRASVGLGIGEF